MNAHLSLRKIFLCYVDQLLTKQDQRHTLEENDVKCPDRIVIYEMVTTSE